MFALPLGLATSRACLALRSSIKPPQLGHASGGAAMHPSASRPRPWTWRREGGCGRCMPLRRWCSTSRRRQLLAVGVRRASVSCFCPGNEGERGVFQKQLGAHEGCVGDHRIVVGWRRWHMCICAQGEWCAYDTVPIQQGGINLHLDVLEFSDATLR
jgi:hypothetical protein